ncbi:hypothetical protein VaNZ11_014254 [Volvox africanus]|uniref:AAA ATPase AAA+ lid domain-containing protein n=1 Tax=Volvox africanus TaxID=51714 RepID=A0ABQ5SJQ6_9CHLO|nr:hypothetical protein VaNZ11_014254 [Volvox africanus]
MKCFAMELAMKRDTYTGQEVLAAATLFLHPALSTASEELHLLHCPNGVGSAPYLPLDAKADDIFEMGALPAAKRLTRVMQTDACMQRKHRTQRTQQQQCRHKRGREQAVAEANEEEHQHQQRSRRTRLSIAPCRTPRAAFVGGDLRRMLASVLTGGLTAVAMVMGNLL